MKAILLRIEDELAERLEAWIDGQKVSPSQNATIKEAIVSFLDSQEDDE